MALSIIKRNPQAWDIDHISEPKWEYKVGLVLKAYENLYETTKNDLYFDYIKDFVDTTIDSTGTIKGYELESYNIDLINSGKLLLKFLTALVANLTQQVASFFADLYALLITFSICLADILGGNNDFKDEALRPPIV